MYRILTPFLAIVLAFGLYGCAGPLIAQEPDRVYDTNSLSDVQEAVVQSMRSVGFSVEDVSMIQQDTYRIRGRNTQHGITVDTRGGGSRAIPFSLVVLVTDGAEGIELRLDTDSQRGGAYGGGSQNMEDARNRFLTNLDSRL